MQMEIKERADTKKKKIKEILESAGVSDKRMAALESVIENTAWMEAKLDDARQAIKNSQIAIPYDNGGGQTGVRENPLFKGYESLWKSYMTGMSVILGALPPEAVNMAVDENAKPKTVLELVRARHTA